MVDTELAQGASPAVTIPRWLGRNELSRFARAVVAAEFAAAILVIVYAGAHNFRDIFAGSPAALPVRVEAHCESFDTAMPCHVSTFEMNTGRYRIATDGPATKITVVVSPAGAVARAALVLVRLGEPQAVQLEIHAGAAAPQSVVPLAGVGVRLVKPLPVVRDAISALVFAGADITIPTRVVLDELAFFENDRGLLIDNRRLFSSIPPRSYHTRLVPRAVGLLCLFTIVAAFALPGPLLRKVNPLVLALVCFALCLVDLGALYSPLVGQDLRSFYASGPLLEPEGANLNTGLWQGFHWLHGQGLTVRPGAVAWERMPGYGLFCALAGAVFGSGTLIDMAVSVVMLQTLVYSAAVGVFAWAAGFVWRPAVVWTLALLVALLPKEIALTQVDAVIAPILLLVLATFCVRLRDTCDGAEPGLMLDLVTHLAFGLWFVMRPDVLPGWVVVAIYLHRRHIHRLLIPAAVFLAIGCSWGAYKLPYMHEFTITTSSAGASLYCGLWEVPSRFALTCSDQSYYDWIHAHTPFDPTTTSANSFAVRQVVKFWITFPGHFVTMLYHKMLRFVDGDMWPGFPTDLQRALFEVVPRPPICLLLLTVLGLCLAVKYERRRTLLMAWPVLLNAPLFWVMFASEGRFYSAAGTALLAATVPPIFEPSFFRTLAKSPFRTGAVLACAVLFVVLRWPLHDWLLQADKFHYWTPLLDPARSPLSGFK